MLSLLGIIRFNAIKCYLFQALLLFLAKLETNCWSLLEYRGYIYRALTDTTYEILWLLRLLQDLVVLIAYATPINCDTLSAIQIAHNNVFHKRLKQIEINCYIFWISSFQGSVLLIYCFPSSTCKHLYQYTSLRTLS